jgi:hypothetical protein
MVIGSIKCNLGGWSLVRFKNGVYFVLVFGGLKNICVRGEPYGSLIMLRTPDRLTERKQDRGWHFHVTVKQDLFACNLPLKALPRDFLVPFGKSSKKFF